MSPIMSLMSKLAGSMAERISFTAETIVITAKNTFPFRTMTEMRDKKSSDPDRTSLSRFKILLHEAH